MNYCTKCQSLYSQPGTCNCFAPPPQTYTTSSLHQCPICHKWGCTETHVTADTTNSVTPLSSATLWLLQAGAYVHSFDPHAPEPGDRTRPS